MARPLAHLVVVLLTACAGGPDPVSLAAEEADVRVPAEGLDLEGTLLLPERIEGEPVAGVVLAHGSGPNSRDSLMAGQLNMSFGLDVAVFRDLAEGLRDRGYAVLRYDKRTCTSVSGCDNDYPTPGAALVVSDFVDDASAALDWLADQPDVDPDRLVLAGHSQGATFAPHLMTERADLVAGVMLAGEYRPIDELVAWQADSSRALLLELGYTDADANAVLSDLDAMVADLAALRAGTFTGVSVRFWEDWLDLTDAAPDLARTLDRPLLAVSGDYDWNVPPSETELWADLFDEVGGEHHGVVLPCLTHALNCIAQPDWMAIDAEDIGGEVDISLLDEVGAFLAGR